MNGRRSGTAVTKANKGAQTRTNPYTEGSRYYDLYESNPLVEAKANYKKTGWDSVLNFLGFRSGYDNAMSEFDIGIANYDAQIAQLKGEDEYNSEQAKAARMRAAGENPDLLGTGGVAGASEFAMEQTSPTIPQVDPNMEKIGNICTGIARAVTLAAGMTGDVLSAVGAYQDITSKKLGIAKSEDEIAEQLLGSMVPELKDIDYYDQYTGNHVKTDWKKAEMKDLSAFVWNQALSWAQDHDLTGKRASRFADRVAARFESNPKKIYDQWTANERSRQDWAQTAGSKYYTGDQDDFTGIIKCMEPLTKLLDDYRLYNAEDASYTEQDKAQYSKTYDATKEATADNKSNDKRIQAEELDKNLTAAKAKVMKDLSAEVEKGNKMAFFLQLTLPLIFSYLEKGSPSYNSTSRTDEKGNETTQRVMSF